MHRTNGIGPYPSIQEKDILINKVNISRDQLDKWFIDKRKKENEGVKQLWNTDASIKA